jgi:hypothetical protein
MQNRGRALAGWFESLRQVTSASKSTNRHRHLAELLEQRVLLSTIVWTGQAGDGDFNNGDNWMGGNVPGESDTAEIDAGTAAVTKSSASVAGLILGGDLAIDNGEIDITSGITFNGGELTLGGSLGSGELDCTGSQSFAGTGTIASGGDPSSGGGGFIKLMGAGSSLTIGNGVTIEGAGITTNDPNTSIVNYGTINQNEVPVPGQEPPGIALVTPFFNYGTVEATKGAIVQFGGPQSDNYGTDADDTGTVTNYGAIVAYSGGGIFIDGALVVHDPGYIAAPGAVGLDHPGAITIGGSLLADTQNIADFVPAGAFNIGPWASFVPPGTAAAPQEIEAMSEDLGPGADGFMNNFVYGSILVEGNTYAKLVDDHQNIALPEAIPEAVYVNQIIVDKGSTLDLNGLNLYTGPNDAAVLGKVIDGQIIYSESERLKIATQPTKGVAGSVVSPAIKVDVLTDRGVLVTPGRPTIQLSISSGPAGGVLSGSRSAQAIGGVATFSGLSFSKPGTYVLVATDELLKAFTRKIVIAPLPPVALAFLRPPTDSIAGSAFAPSVTVQLLDQNGQPALATRASTVRLKIASGPARGRLFGSAAVTANGIATLKHLMMKVAGTYTLTASDGTLKTTTSPPFMVSAASPSNAKFIPPRITATAAAIVTFSVELLDRFGNVALMDPSSLILDLTKQPKGSDADSALTSAGISGGGSSDLFTDQLLTAGVYVFALDDVANHLIHPRAMVLVRRPE